MALGPFAPPSPAFVRGLVKFAFLYQALRNDSSVPNNFDITESKFPSSDKVVEAQNRRERYHGLDLNLPVRGPVHVPVPICDPGSIPACEGGVKYRTIDGTCNNLANPWWGAAGTALRRLLPPAYASGESGKPRGGFLSAGAQCGDGNFSSPDLDDGECSTNASRVLPNPRRVSREMHEIGNKPESRLTLLFTYFGQFLSHDLSLTPEEKLERCCGDREGKGARFGGKCFPVMVNCDDDQYEDHKCWELPRSAPFCPDHNTDAVREQFNSVTSFIDASQVYGSDGTTAKEIRAYKGGRLKSSPGGLLPTMEEDGDKFCAGEKRSGEVPGLSSMHALFLREHNRLAAELESEGWKEDEEIYQEARRILVAEIQNIVYGQYLPSLLGADSLLPPESNASSNSYSAEIDPSVSNSFATAVFRFGHSMVQDLIRLEGSELSSRDPPSYHLKDQFFDPTSHNHRTHFPDILRAFAHMPSQGCDLLFNADVREKLFLVMEERDGVLGNASMAIKVPDLAARNLHRGREHGLPGYNAFRRHCGLEQACSWDSRPGEIPEDTWGRLRGLYQDPDDVDLFTAGLAETPESGSILGPTFSCIMRRQFKDLMDGDAFFFTHQTNPHPFTSGQLSNLRRRTLNDVICDNLPIRNLPTDPFVRDSPVKSCATNNRIDIRLFSKERENSPLPDLNIGDFHKVKHICSDADIKCDRSDLFRTIDGTCNNLRHPSWGASGTHLRRLLDAEYSDTENTPRGGWEAAGEQCENTEVENVDCDTFDLSSSGKTVGGALPNPRRVSLSLHGTDEQDDKRATLLLTYFGQLLAHDTDWSPDMKPKGGSCCVDRGSSDFDLQEISCPGGTGVTHVPKGDHACFPMMTSCGDEYHQSGHRCFDFVRSVPWCNVSDTFYREPVNAVTSFVDASNVYGSDDRSAAALRAGKGGLLRTSHGSSLLPYAVVKGKDNHNDVLKRLFVAGDDRVRVVPGLSAMHMVFVLEHNRVARGLAKHLNNASDEVLYQLARAVVGAEMQNIAFGQYASAVLGESLIPSGLSQYLPDEDPTVSAEFATAAFRFGHSMIQGLIRMKTKKPAAKTEEPADYRIRDQFKDPDSFVYRHNFGDLLRTLIGQPSQTCDLSVVEDAREELFLVDEERKGNLADKKKAVKVPDLAARNIHRGRDHGLPGYISYRRYCGLYEPSDCRWREGPEDLDREAWRKMKELYQSPRDIDLFSGGLAERPRHELDLEGTPLVGPTFRCLLLEQFLRLRDGDRFFFAHRDGAQSWLFKGHLEHFKRRNLGDILCDVVEGMDEVSENVFLRDSPPLDCNSEDAVADLDLEGLARAAERKLNEGGEIELD